MTEAMLSALSRNPPLFPAETVQAVPVGAAAMERENRHETLIPYLDRSVELTSHDPAVRLDPVRSGFGVATVTGTHPGHGVEAFVWEKNNLDGGLVLPDQYSILPPPVCVGYHRSSGPNAVVVDMTQFRGLRRLVLAAQTTDLVITFAPSGAKILLRTHAGSNVLLMSRIGNEIEVRREAVEGTDLLGSFGVAHSPFPSPDDAQVKFW